jgi:thioredoxin reductase
VGAPELRAVGHRAIVTSSFAGLSAALPLARARRRVAVFDTGMRRNRFALAGTAAHASLFQPEA